MLVHMPSQTTIRPIQLTLTWEESGRLFTACTVARGYYADTAIPELEGGNTDVLLEFGIALNEQQPGVEEADLFPAAIAYAKGIYREIRSAKRAARRGSLRGLASRAEGKETPEGAAPGFARRSHGLR